MQNTPDFGLAASQSNFAAQFFGRVVPATQPGCFGILESAFSILKGWPRSNLGGHAAYCQQVRYRLVPHIW